MKRKLMYNLYIIKYKGAIRLKIKSVKHNYIIKTLTIASAVLVPLISYPYVSRVIGPSGIGKVNFANSIVYYFLIIAQLGIPTYGVRTIAKVRDNKEELARTSREILILNAVMCAIALILLAASVAAVPQLRQEKTLMFYFSFMIVLNTMSCEWLYYGLEQYDFLGLSTIFVRILSAILMLTLIKKESDYTLYGLFYVICMSGYGIINIINVPRLIGRRPEGKYDIKRHLKPVGIFFAMAIATTIYTQMDSAMLGFISGTTENGYYDAAVKVKTVLVAAVTTLGGVLLPRVSNYLEKGEKKRFYETSAKALNFVVELSLPCTVFFILFARGTIMFLSGSEFENAVLPMKLIMPSVILVGITGITGIQMMVPLGYEKTVLRSEIAGAAVNLIINALLIPQMGASGAAIGTVAAEAAVLIVQFTAIRDCLKDLLKGVSWIKIILSTALASAASLWCENVFLALIVFFTVYLAALIVTKETLARELMTELKDKIVTK